MVWRDTEFNEQRNIAVMPRELVAYLTDLALRLPAYQGAEGAIRRNPTSRATRVATLYYQFVKPSESCR